MQLTFGDAEGLGQRKKAHRELFLNEMDQAIPWKRPLALIEPHYPLTGRRGRQPYPLATAAHPLPAAVVRPERPVDGRSAVRHGGDAPNCRHQQSWIAFLTRPRSSISAGLLETHGLRAKMLEAVNAHPQHQGLSLRAGTIVDATIIHAPSSTKNADKARDPEMHPTR